MKKTNKKDFTSILLGILFTVGLSLLTYPTISDWWNSMHATQVVDSYNETVASMDSEEYAALIAQAQQYNEELKNRSGRFYTQDEKYEEMLNVPGSSVMATIQIPKLNIKLPIYHGTSESILQSSIGHLEGSSLPVGGLGTHAVLSGHRGLPSAKLFTDLDEMEIGDYFIVTVLNETLTYVVDKISIIEPSDFSEFQIDDDQDYITLMTCTPYGINTHRLLVRGYRVDNLPEDYIYTRAEAGVINRNTISAIFMAILLAFLFAFLGIRSGMNKHFRKKGDEI